MATRMLNQMLGEVDSITQLAQELLDLSMIESGQMPMQVTRANLHEIVDEQIVHYEALAQQKHLIVEDDVPIDLMAEVDRKMIGRVLGNLIHNAIKFTPDRGRITIAAVPSDGQDQSQRGRYRRGHSCRRSAAHLRTVLQSGSRARQERHGVGVSHRAARGGSARRPHLGRKRGRQGRDVLLHTARSEMTNDQHSQLPLVICHCSLFKAIAHTRTVTMRFGSAASSSIFSRSQRMCTSTVRVSPG